MKNCSFRIYFASYGGDALEERGNIEGEYPVKNDDVVRIEEILGEKLPVGLEYFIGVYA